MNEKLTLRHRIKNLNGSGVLLLEGETDGRPFVRLDNELGAARYCVRLTHRDAGELGQALLKLGMTDRSAGLNAGGD